MTKLFTVLFLLLLIPSLVFAGNSKKVLVVGKIIYKPYELSLLGFVQSCEQKVVFFNTYGLRKKDIHRRIYQEKPDLIVTIGGESLADVGSLKDFRVFSLMALPQRIFQKTKRVTGISIEIAPILQLQALHRTFPSAKKVGVFYDPKHSQEFIDTAKTAAQGLGLTLLPLIVKTPSEVSEALVEIKKQAEVLWMIPDPSIITAETIETFFGFSLSNKLPIMTFSEKYTDLGAAIALTADPEETGRQAGRLVDKMFRDGNGTYSGIYTNNAITTLNLRVIDQLGIEANVESNKTLQVINQ